MAQIVEKKGKKYNIWDKVNQVWNKCSFWTSSDDVDFGDDNATNKLGAINGITSDLSGEADDIAASIKCVNQLNNSLGGLRFGTDGDGNVGYYGDDDVLIPFKSTSGELLYWSSTNSTTWIFTNKYIVPADGYICGAVYQSSPTQVTVGARIHLNGTVVYERNKGSVCASNMHYKVAKGDEVYFSYCSSTTGAHANCLVAYLKIDNMDGIL